MYINRYGRPIRIFPEVDPSTFVSSAVEMKNLMNEASFLLEKVQTSKQFATSLMIAAQQSNKQEVTKLIENAGINARINVDYTPDGLDLKLYSKVKACCQLRMVLRW